MATAIYNPSTNNVKSLIRDDYGSYTPPAPYVLTPESELPAGWTLEPPDMVLQPVESITPRQARLALQQAGMLDAVTAWIATAPASVQIDWEFALEVRRDWPPIEECREALGLTEDQLDALFATASTL